jgi:hypothetical protein
VLGGLSVGKMATGAHDGPVDESDANLWVPGSRTGGIAEVRVARERIHASCGTV